jgi:SPP1 gp7 family putative phage head morphogenesis protein
MSAINQIAGVELMSTAVTAEKLRVLATDIMIQGAPSREWWSRIASDSQTKFLDTIRQGMLKGDETQKITKALRENVFPVTQRNANALVRTSIQTVNASVRLATFQANDDVVKLIQQRSTLDRRTTQICMAYSGKVWTNDDKHDPVGHDLPFVNEPDGSPDGIPRHWNCRSIFLPIVRSWEELGAAGIKTGGRPSGKPDQYFRTRLAAKGLTDEQIEDVITNAQASMDGAVPKDWDYETWLKTKSVDFQKDVLGEGKWNLWQKGKITFSDLVDQTGNPLTLEQLLEKIKN